MEDQVDSEGGASPTRRKRRRSKGGIRRSSLWVVLVIAGSHAAVVLIHAATLLSTGEGAGSWLEYFGILGLTAFFTVLWAFSKGYSRRYESLMRELCFVVALTLAGCSFLPAFAVLLVAVHEVQDYANSACVRQLTPVVSAIESYTLDLGHPPKSLRDLVPDYIKSLPSKKYGLRLIDEGGLGSMYVGENTWGLWAFWREEFMGAYGLLYLPLENYEEIQTHDFDGERIGSWAQIHVLHSS